jgi:hypothetical protein
LNQSREQKKFEKRQEKGRTNEEVNKESGNAPIQKPQNTVDRNSGKETKEETPW